MAPSGAGPEVQLSDLAVGVGVIGAGPVRATGGAPCRGTSTLGRDSVFGRGPLKLDWWAARSLWCLGGLFPGGNGKRNGSLDDLPDGSLLALVDLVRRRRRLSWPHRTEYQHRRGDQTDDDSLHADSFPLPLRASSGPTLGVPSV